MWTDDGTWRRLEAGDFSIAVRDAVEPAIEEAVEVFVTYAGRRWNADFFTPEQVRECLDRWASSGESLPGAYFGWVNAIIISTVTLDGIEAAVRDHLWEKDSTMLRPFLPCDH